MGAYQFIVPRLDGNLIEQDFDRYSKLVKSGVAGFIVFGGELHTLRDGIRRLQEVSDKTLLIASDLERGLGQQVKGGSLFPPAMAFSRIDIELAGAAFSAIADEASYAGINMILAPVLDVNSNPDNPIISTRSFGEDAETVSGLGLNMIKAFRKSGIASCGKHFPGHGDTNIDSHIALPTISKSLNGLKKCELIPFDRAIKAGVDSIMLGHLNAKALDKNGLPVSVSKEAVDYLREKMAFNGILTTDAINMGGLAGLSEKDASVLALKAGVDIILHPTDPERLAGELENNIRAVPIRLLKFREALATKTPSDKVPDFQYNGNLSLKITKASITTDGEIKNKDGLLNDMFLLVLNDDDNEKGVSLINALISASPRLGHFILKQGQTTPAIPRGCRLAVAVFSGISAWKGGPSKWLKRMICDLEERAEVIISFGSPYLIREAKYPTKIYTWWDSVDSELAVSELLS